MSFIVCIISTFRWIVLLVTVDFGTTRYLRQCLMLETTFAVELVEVRSSKNSH